MCHVRSLRPLSSRHICIDRLLSSYYVSIQAPSWCSAIVKTVHQQFDAIISSYYMFVCASTRSSYCDVCIRVRVCVRRVIEMPGKQLDLFRLALQGLANAFEMDFLFCAYFSLCAAGLSHRYTTYLFGRKCASVSRPENLNACKKCNLHSQCTRIADSSTMHTELL